MNEECSLNPGSGKAASGSEQAQLIVQVELPWEQSPLDTDFVVQRGASQPGQSSLLLLWETFNCYLMLFLLKIGITVTPTRRLETPEVELLNSVIAWSAPEQLMGSPWSAPGHGTACEEQTGPFPGLPSIVRGSTSPCARVSLGLGEGADGFQSLFNKVASSNPFY